MRPSLSANQAPRDLLPLDRRIAFDVRAKLFIAGFVEPQMMDAHLGRDAFFRAVALRKKAHLDRGCQVQDMQQRVVATCQVDRQLDDLRHASAERILGCSLKRHIFAVLLLALRLVFPDRRRIFAMRQHNHRRMLEKLVERVGIVDQHVAGRCTHEGLDSAASPTCSALISSILLFVAPR